MGRVRLAAIGLLVFFFSTIAFLSLNVNGYCQKVYIGELSAGSHSQPLILAFYGNRFSKYLSDGRIKFSKNEWQIDKLQDLTILTGKSSFSKISFLSYADPVQVSLVLSSNHNKALLKDGLNSYHDIDLHGNPDSVYTLNIGGNQSLVPAIKGSTYSPWALISIYGLIFLIFSLLSSYQLRSHPIFNRKNNFHLSSGGELVGYALPLCLSPFLFQLSYWPASVPYDGGLQWMEAAFPGVLTDAIGISTTLFFRFFTKISFNPASVIMLQIALAGFGVALILREIRQRGAPWWIVQLYALCLCILPQYPTFFATLSKDAWNGIGIVYLIYATLSLLRHYNKSPYNNRCIIFLTILMIISAAFAGAMRPNTLPAIFLFMIFAAIFLKKAMGLKLTIAFFIGYLILAIAGPKLALFLSKEHQQAREIPKEQVVSNDGFPLGVFANFYIFHLFSSAAHNNLYINPKDADIFYKIASPSTWQVYYCDNPDATHAALANNLLMNDKIKLSYLVHNQTKMASIILHLMYKNPRSFLKHELCVTKMLWSIAYKTVPFQTNATLGYDNVPDNFIATVGDNHSLIGASSRAVITGYVQWSQDWNRFWLFWKPFLFLCLGLFATLLYSLVNKKYDALLVLTLPLMLTLSLAIVIPFPAFRYEYPATLLFMLFFLFLFVKPNKSD